MKKYAFSLLLFFFVGGLMVSAQTTKKLSKVIELKMPESDGTNGAGVAWHPKNKRYYAGFAGNSSFGLAVFKESGEMVWGDGLETMVDLRGLWYNNGAIEGNCFDEGGWFRYTLDNNGEPFTYEEILPGYHQPTPQSAGAFDEKNGLVYFLGENGNVIPYKFEGGAVKEEITLEMGKTSKKDYGTSREEYNMTTVLYIGEKKAEFALLNVETRMLEYYNKKTGLITRKASFPSDTYLPSRLNLAYANGIVFVFDIDQRIWMGFK